VDLLRRLIGLVLALVLVASLPIAAVRAGCVCDHGHPHGEDAASAEPHTCTAACTAATCPMHRGEAAPRHAASRDTDLPATGDRFGCSCASEGLRLIGRAAPPAIVPDHVAVPRPPIARVEARGLAASPLGLAPTPPAPPPRA
jgi:hypothetical protein